jgi:predicted GH43/DUF377 family glycosyl hydrolase
MPGQELVGGGEARTASTVARVMALSDEDVATELADLIRRFGTRHDDLTAVFERNARHVLGLIADEREFPRSRLLVLGAAFTHEYSIEGAAVCNPSLVLHPDQKNLNPGDTRVVLSFRSIGEGHHSSIAFRNGVIGADGKLEIERPAPFPVVANIAPMSMSLNVFEEKMLEVMDHSAVDPLVADLSARVDGDALDRALALARERDPSTTTAELVHFAKRVLARSYEATFDASVDLSRRVLWPSSPAESQGVEDARFVRFDDDELIRYLATYTAFDGHEISQQILETTDFVSFHSSPLVGFGARNKGLAIFPRRINGRFAALSRYDRESNALAFSDDLSHWDDASTIQLPNRTWEIVQLGNCGAPIELESGWLVITHGVGPMRTYGIGAVLLDLDDPTKVIAQLDEPLLVPADDERDGYVPNVVYSCGSLLHNGTIYLPYGIADGALGIATIVADELNAAFTSRTPLAVGLEQLFASEDVGD